MKTFTDNSGRTWTVAMNVAVLKRVKSLAGVDLNTMLDGGELLGRLTSDAILFGEVLWAAIVPEAAAKNVGEDDFLGALAGDAIEQAREALLAEVVGFTPNPRDRARLTRVLEKWDRYQATARDMLDARVDQGDRAFATAFRKAMAEADAAMGLEQADAESPNPQAESPGGSSTRPPGSAESTPDPSPSLS